MSDIDLTDLARRHHLNPHDFGCSCGQWTYRAENPLYGIDFEGHLIHVAEVTAAQVREQIAAEIEEDRLAIKNRHGGEPVDQYVRGVLYGQSVAAHIARNAS